jgi:Phytanoyl-CoA dioxygenase (PhyH)
VDISFDPAGDDQGRRLRTYQGELTILPPSASSLALVRHARDHIEAAFAPRHPRHAHEELAVMETVQILARLKPQFIHHPQTRSHLQRLLIDVGCDPDQTFQDVPRLRVAYPADYLTTGLAYAHHPHRDTWYSAPPCQLNWWMPIYDFDANQGMAFHPRYWGASIRNSSADFNYYRWNADGRKNAAQHVKSDTRVQPHAEEELELEPAVRLVVPAGGIILFSGAQLHSTVRNETSLARWSIDFRTVNIDDLANRRAPSTSDSASTGTSLRDFRRVADFETMPAEIVAMYDDTPVSEGVAVFGPGASQAEERQSAATSRPAAFDVEALVRGVPPAEEETEVLKARLVAANKLPSSD